MKTMGEVHPHLLADPRWHWLAAEEYPYPKASDQTIDATVRNAVLACSERGTEGGLILTDAEKTCCDSGPERTACNAGKGQFPGRVTLRECLECKAP